MVHDVRIDKLERHLQSRAKQNEHMTRESWMELLDIDVPKLKVTRSSLYLVYLVLYNSQSLLPTRAAVSIDVAAHLPLGGPVGTNSSRLCASIVRCSRKSAVCKTTAKLTHGW